jgi:RNA polymerase sigma-70 factor, ECF subfamily
VRFAVSNLQEGSQPLNPCTVTTPRELPLNETSSTDARLVDRFLGGDEAAFETLFRKYQSYVYNICFGILNNAEDAADVTQETFLRAHARMCQFRGDACVSTWLYRVAVNLAITELRRRTRARAQSLDEIDPDGELCRAPSSQELAPDTALELDEERALVRRVLNTLPGEYRAVIVLRHFQQLAYEEIAETLEVSLSQVKTRLHRARKMFKDRFLLYSRDTNDLQAS